ncbi:hypothetical protein [Paenibacillus eucommiae]|uniref:Uncharacterized protein n=1 Tax=Paenibacillus eucommiae TaxID=1355755 RepID=A0ABS4JAI6_9BACL|nr:hypothetical protein [Paenibacillus eucommiae]MBP1996857.1 hypothetical protein [Paenibacillus eucommiae]
MEWGKKLPSGSGIATITRPKNNAVIDPLHSFEIPRASQVSIDEKIRLGSLQKRNKHDLRMIQTVDFKGNLLVLVTNRFDLACDEIGEMYRSRWERTGPKNSRMT